MIGGGDGTCAVIFEGNSSAGTAIVSSSNAFIGFNDNASAASADIPVFGGTVAFRDSSIGGTAQIELQSDDFAFRPANLVISEHNFPGVTIGSLKSFAGIGEGDELLFT